MYIHNNSSSTLPFIPSSTSILTAHQLSKPPAAGVPGVPGSTGSLTPKGTLQAWQLPSESLHRKQLIPTRTLNSVQNMKTKTKQVISHHSVQQKQLLSRSGGSGSGTGTGDSDLRSRGGGPIGGLAGSAPLVSVPIRHWWMVSFFYLIILFDLADEKGLKT